MVGKVTVNCTPLHVNVYTDNCKREQNYAIEKEHRRKGLDTSQESTTTPMTSASSVVPGGDPMLSLVITLSAVALASSGRVVARQPAIALSAKAVLLLLPGSMLLWAAAPFFTRDFRTPSALVGVLMCALPTVGMSLYMRLLLRQGHDWGATAHPGRAERRWLTVAVCAMSLAVGCVRVMCYPEGLVASLAHARGFEWYYRWLLTTLVGCSPTLLWWTALQRTSVITRDPHRWRPGWAWWSQTHRQYVLFLLLLFTPILRTVGHIGALLADAALPPDDEPVGAMVPLLALGALGVFFCGIDFAAEAEKAAAAAELAAAERRAADPRAAAAYDPRTGLDDGDSYYSDDSADGSVAWERATWRDAADGGGGGGERGRAGARASPWLSPRHSSWNLVAWLVVVLIELPHGLTALAEQLAAAAHATLREREWAAAGDAPYAALGDAARDALASPAAASARSLAAVEVPAGSSALVHAYDAWRRSHAPPGGVLAVVSRFVCAELPSDGTTLGAALLVSLLTFVALQLTEWQPRSGWVWLPGGGAGASIGLFALAASPRAVLPASLLLFLCMVSAFEVCGALSLPSHRRPLPRPPIVSSPRSGIASRAALSRARAPPPARRVVRSCTPARTTRRTRARVRVHDASYARARPHPPAYACTPIRSSFLSPSTPTPNTPPTRASRPTSVRRANGCPHASSRQWPRSFGWPRRCGCCWHSEPPPPPPPSPLAPRARVRPFSMSAP